MTEQDKLREAIKRIDDYSGISREDVTRVARAAEQSLTFRRLPVPGELDDKLLRAMWDAAFDDEPMKREPAMRAAYKALYEHLTKPKRVWRVSAGGINIVHVHETEDAALERAKELLRNGEVAVITSTKESA